MLNYDNGWIAAVSWVVRKEFKIVEKKKDSFRKIKFTLLGKCFLVFFVLVGWGLLAVVLGVFVCGEMFYDIYLFG